MLEFLADLSVGYTSALGIAVLIILLSIWISLQKPDNMPPGPIGYPFIGNLMDLSNQPWKNYVKISKKYGPIFSHKLATIQTVVVNNLELAKEGLLKKQVEFAGRPQNIYSLNLLTDGGKNIVFGNYGPVWKAQKKIGFTAIRTYATGKNLEELIHDIYPMIEELFEKKINEPFDPIETLYLVVYNIICSMVFGCRYSMEDKDFRTLMGISRDLFESYGNGLAADVIPLAKYIPTSGLQKVKKFYKELMEILNRKFREHKDNFDPDNMKDLIDFFLNAQKVAVIQQEDAASKLTDSHVVQMISDVFFAGTDTSIYTMYWAIALMAAHPEVQVKVHEEICDLMGKERYPQLADQTSLPYTSATMREIMRRGPVAPSMIPHTATCDTELGGYFIPKDTMVIFNMYALHFDPKEWDNPEDFRPERFLDEDGKLLPKPAALMPFGAGRRVCMGEILAKSEIFMLFAFFFQWFKVSAVPGKPVPGVDTMGGGGVFAPTHYSINISRRE